ncbi:MAG: Heme A synthase, cytochrome oxidase biogenesis protein Cox15-CtaA, partial [uncultured Blastococcus sp.]
AGAAHVLLPQDRLPRRTGQRRGQRSDRRDRRSGPADRLGAGLPDLAALHRRQLRDDAGAGRSRRHRVRQPVADLRAHRGGDRDRRRRLALPPPGPAAARRPDLPRHPGPGPARGRHGADRTQPLDRRGALPGVGGARRTGDHVVAALARARGRPAAAAPPTRAAHRRHRRGHRRGARPRHRGHRRRAAQRRPERLRPDGLRPRDGQPAARRPGLPPGRADGGPAAGPLRDRLPRPHPAGRARPARRAARPGRRRLRAVLHRPADRPGARAHAGRRADHRVHGSAGVVGPRPGVRAAAGIPRPASGRHPL